MDNKTYLDLKRQRREILAQIKSDDSSQLKDKLAAINKQIEGDPPTVEQIYLALGE